ncbi:hypothetical protein H9Y04_01295 [Streptomyces sp. TRM66268-LWL]|uniref:Uncharacterized protein n=1 Tax=Streptomyces polyasparticus TaxID=2767826 RepID=A0ABR7S9K8_9ACTN|nr:hypothetical protein [Streptomyces polyasparticus]MBC9711206.1 hypothetical protein [Streptomyces polyasparticus]
MTTNTLFDWFTVLFVFALLAAPSLVGYAQDRRIDRQLKQAERRPLGSSARIHRFVPRASAAADRPAHSRAA